MVLVQFVYDAVSVAIGGVSMLSCLLGIAVASR